MFWFSEDVSCLIDQTFNSISVKTGSGRASSGVSEEADKLCLLSSSTSSWLLDACCVASASVLSGSRNKAFLRRAVNKGLNVLFLEIYKVLWIMWLMCHCLAPGCSST